MKRQFKIDDLLLSCGDHRFTFGGSFVFIIAISPSCKLSLSSFFDCEIKPCA